MTDNSALRPTKLADMIGMEDNRRRIGMSIKAAKDRGEALGHLLISGSRGQGKSTLAMCVANEIGTKLHIVNAATIKKDEDLIGLLAKSIGAFDAVFVDELHGLSTRICEMLYTALEDFRLDVPRGKTRHIININLKPFTLIGATTDVGKVPAPMRDRFRLREQLTPYSNEDIAKIITLNAQKLGRYIHEDAAMAIAVRSRNTPRISVNHLYWVRDYAHVKNYKDITLDLVEEAMKEQGIDAMGFTPTDRTYLKELCDTFNGGPAGLSALSNQLLIEPCTLEADIEPYLMMKELILRTPGGRCLTSRGWIYCQDTFK